MADFSKFRSALNGFNRTDVVNYVEAVSLEHQKETRQLREETERLAAERDALTVEKAALVRLPSVNVWCTLRPMVRTLTTWILLS